MNEVEKERKKEYNNKEYTYTYTRIPRKNITLYFPEAFQHTLKKLKQIVAQERCSLSKWFRREAESYVNIHWPGNPQLPLTRYTNPQQSLCECGGQPYYRVTFSPTGPIMFLCQSCFPEFRPTHSGFSFIELDRWKERKR